jgi:hypothetical protein
LLLTLLVLRPLELRANCSPPSEAVTSEIGLDSEPVETAVKLKLSETGNAVAATRVTLPSTGATIETTGGVNAGAAVTEAWMKVPTLRSPIPGTTVQPDVVIL